MKAITSSEKDDDGDIENDSVKIERGASSQRKRRQKNILISQN